MTEMYFTHVFYKVDRGMTNKKRHFMFFFHSTLGIPFGRVSLPVVTESMHILMQSF